MRCMTHMAMTIMQPTAIDRRMTTHRPRKMLAMIRMRLRQAHMNFPPARAAIIRMKARWSC